MNLIFLIMNGILDRLRSRSGNKRIRAEPSEPVHQGTEAVIEEAAESNAVVPDVPEERHDEGSGDGATERDVQGQSEGSADSSGAASDRLVTLIQ